MSEIKTRLTWEDGQYTTKNGKAGDLRLFAITWKSRREEPNWLMRCDLPGYTGREWKHDDETVLQAKAETLLDTWLARVNGSPL